MGKAWRGVYILKIMKKRIDVAAVPAVTGSLYPSPFDEPCLKKDRRRLGELAGLTQFGVNLLRLQPGAWSSQRHWHTKEDEFVYVLAGEVYSLPMMAKKSCARAMPPGSSRAIATAIACKTAQTATRRYSKSERAPRRALRITRKLTWWRRPDISLRSIPIVMARHTRTSRAAVEGAHLCQCV